MKNILEWPLRPPPPNIKDLQGPLRELPPPPDGSVDRPDEEDSPPCPCRSLLPDRYLVSREIGGPNGLGNVTRMAVVNRCGVCDDQWLELALQ